MCPLSSVSFECAPNTQTATVCQCDRRFEQPTIPVEGPTDDGSAYQGTETSGELLSTQATRDNYTSSSSSPLTDPTDESPTLNAASPVCLGKYFFVCSSKCWHIASSTQITSSRLEKEMEMPRFLRP